jgi:hypothetical protein
MALLRGRTHVVARSHAEKGMELIDGLGAMPLRSSLRWLRRPRSTCFDCCQYVHEILVFQLLNCACASTGRSSWGGLAGAWQHGCGSKARSAAHQRCSGLVVRGVGLVTRVKIRVETAYLTGMDPKLRYIAPKSFLASVCSHLLQPRRARGAKHLLCSVSSLLLSQGNVLGWILPPEKEENRNLAL